MTDVSKNTSSVVVQLDKEDQYTQDASTMMRKTWVVPGERLAARALDFNPQARRESVGILLLDFAEFSPLARPHSPNGPCVVQQGLGEFAMSIWLHDL
jgi:hypothetical protein